MRKRIAPLVCLVAATCCGCIDGPHSVLASLVGGSGEPAADVGRAVPTNGDAVGSDTPGRGRDAMPGAAASRRARQVVQEVGVRLGCTQLSAERPGPGTWTATCLRAADGSEADLTGFDDAARFDANIAHFAMAPSRTLIFGDRWLVSAPANSSEFVRAALPEGRVVTVAR